jgi:hypothetical protein
MSVTNVKFEITSTTTVYTPKPIQCLILVDNQLDAELFYNTFIYLNPLHISSTFVLILRRKVVRIHLVKSLCVNGRPALPDAH